MRYIDQENYVEYCIKENSNICVKINNEEQRVVEKSEFSNWAKQLFAEMSSIKKKDASSYTTVKTIVGGDVLSYTDTRTLTISLKEAWCLLPLYREPVSFQ